MAGLNNWPVRGELRRIQFFDEHFLGAAERAEWVERDGIILCIKSTYAHRARI